jgi:hypothetical protein
VTSKYTDKGVTDFTITNTNGTLTYDNLFDIFIQDRAVSALKVTDTINYALNIDSI